MIVETITGIMIFICSITGIGMTELEPINVTIDMDNKIKLTELNEIKLFLEEDKTDKYKYNNDPRNGVKYTCGHYARDLSKNASLNNINISGFTITENTYPLIKGYNNHAINYFTINNTMYFIEPQTDEILTAKDLYNRGYNYGKTYPDGTMIPTNFRGSVAASYDLSKHLKETLD